MWEMLKYSVPLGVATMLGTMTLQLSSMIVSSMCMPEEFAVYSVGAIELPLIGIVTGSITTVILADMARLCQEGRKDEALRLFHTGALRSAAILLPATVFFWIAARPFIEGLYSARYSESVLPFRLYLLVLPIRIVTYGAALMALGKTKLVLFRSIFDFLFNGALCVILVALFGYLGGVLAMLVTLYSWTSVYNLHAIAKGFGVRFTEVLPLAKLARILGIAAVAGIPAWILVTMLSVPQIVQLLLAVVAYWPMAGFLLKREGFLPLPEIFDRVLTKARALCGSSGPV
jgi:O-antigen/teichoic acid export membrane protein